MSTVAAEKVTHCNVKTVNYVRNYAVPGIQAHKIIFRINKRGCVSFIKIRSYGVKRGGMVRGGGWVAPSRKYFPPG